MALTVKPVKGRFLAIGIGVVIAVIGLFFGLRTINSRAAGESPQAVAVGEITSTSAVITWETDNPVQEGVRYGKGAAESDLTSIAPETEASKKHKVELSLLEAGTTYYFNIIGATDTDYSNSGVSWTFTTASDSASTPTSGTQKKTTGKSIQHLVIPNDATAVTTAPTSAPSINCKTETNCDLIKANFSKGCSTSDYVACTYKAAQ